MPCPSSTCTCMFKTTSGIAHHIESGIHGVNRHQVTKAIQSIDRDKVISIKHVTSSGASPQAPPHQFFTSANTNNTSNIVPVFDGKRYHCPRCPKKCKLLNSLYVHMNSAAHDADEFKCPRCATKFKLFSALAQHVEAFGCTTRSNTIDTEKYIQGITAKAMRLAL